MINFKAIVLDLDGTLLNKHNQISEVNKKFLLQEKKRGTQIIIATGRPISTTLPYHQELDLETPLICLNGAVVYDRINKKVINQKPILDNQVVEVKNVVEDDAIAMVIQTYEKNYQLINLIGSKIEENWPVEKPDVVPGEDEKVLKMRVIFRNEEIARKMLKKFPANLQIADRGDRFEVTNQFVTKWHTLKEVLDDYGISDKEVIAFGDGSNDIEMIKNVGAGVAMENAIPSVKKVAKYMTSSHEEDGIYKFLYHLSVNRKVVSD